VFGRYKHDHGDQGSCRRPDHAPPVLGALSIGFGYTRLGSNDNTIIFLVCTDTLGFLPQPGCVALLSSP
jgi:hypothetical protein